MLSFYEIKITVCKNNTKRRKRDIIFPQDMVITQKNILFHYGLIFINH